MISELALKVLTFIRDNGSTYAQDLEEPFKGENYHSAVENLKSEGLIKQPEIQPRRRNKYEQPYIPEQPYYITDKGKAYIESSKEHKFDRKHRIFHDWINTAIALAALVLSIIALAK